MNISHFKKVYQGLKSHHGEVSKVEDHIVVEEALQINLNGKPFTVTMRTPGSDRYLIRGLLFTEGIYTGQDALKMKAIEFTEEGYPAIVNVSIPPSEIGGAYYQTRSMLSVSSCGICGKRELTDLLQGGDPLNDELKMELSIISKMFTKMKKLQVAFHCTGGSHAAAVFTESGELIAIQEDIGRHNAVDKVIGHLINEGQLDKVKCILVSGRISYEIVSKTYKAGISFLAAVSSPSSLSIESARGMGITLMAFCRGEAITCYTHEDRIVLTQLTP
ncbi:MAG: formate dehydrogenase accessory sulfurtransferase FdhD [Saprospiraceae bacterium]|nr:formate dehydrogenase accessory sulfurtransferase FdhD [Saprospiraceae bacterium]